MRYTSRARGCSHDVTPTISGSRSRASLWMPASARAATSGFPYPEFEGRIARRDFRDITKDVLPTPCMVVDLDLFEKNVKTMADHCKKAGINVRPHVKIHKS